jgi:hypothetical protein
LDNSFLGSLELQINGRLIELTPARTPLVESKSNGLYLGYS